jgi:hypothetical protein
VTAFAVCLLYFLSVTTMFNVDDGSKKKIASKPLCWPCVQHNYGNLSCTHSWYRNVYVNVYAFMTLNHCDYTVPQVTIFRPLKVWINLIIICISGSISRGSFMAPEIHVQLGQELDSCHQQIVELYRSQCAGDKLDKAVKDFSQNFHSSPWGEVITEGSLSYFHRTGELSLL